jgi:hypothetical protein
VRPVHLVELPSGCRIELPLERMLAFCRAEYAYYDAIPSTHPDRIDPVKAEERVSVPNLLVYVCMRGNTASLPL